MDKKIVEKVALLKQLSRAQDLFVDHVLQINFGPVEDLLSNTEQAYYQDKLIKHLKDKLRKL